MKNLIFSLVLLLASDPARATEDGCSDFRIDKIVANTDAQAGAYLALSAISGGVTVAAAVVNHPYILAPAAAMAGSAMQANHRAQSGRDFRNIMNDIDIGDGIDLQKSYKSSVLDFAKQAFEQGVKNLNLNYYEFVQSLQKLKDNGVLCDGLVTAPNLKHFGKLAITDILQSRTENVAK